MVCAHWHHLQVPGQAPHAALVVAAGMGSWLGSLKASKTRLARSGSPLLNSASAARKAFIRKSSSPAARSTRSMKAPRSINFARASKKYKSSTCWRVIRSCRLLALYGIWAALQPPFPESLGLRPRPETIEPGGKQGRLEVAEGKRGGAQRVGLQRRPGLKVGRGLNDHHLAGWTPRAEFELAIGGVAEIGDGQRLAQHCLHKPSRTIIPSAHCIAARAEGCVGWQRQAGQLPPPRDADARTEICPRCAAVGRVFKGRAPDFRAGAPAHPGQGRAIKGQALGSWSGVVEPANVIAALPGQRGEGAPYQKLPVRL